MFNLYVKKLQTNVQNELKRYLQSIPASRYWRHESHLENPARIHNENKEDEDDVARRSLDVLICYPKTEVLHLFLLSFQVKEAIQRLSSRKYLEVLQLCQWNLIPSKQLNHLSVLINIVKTFLDGRKESGQTSVRLRKNVQTSRSTCNNYSRPNS